MFMLYCSASSFVTRCCQSQPKTSLHSSLPPFTRPNISNNSRLDWTDKIKTGSSFLNNIQYILQQPTRSPRDYRLFRLHQAWAASSSRALLQGPVEFRFFQQRTPRFRSLVLLQSHTLHTSTLIQLAAMLVSPIVSDQGYASTINSPICDSDNERFSNEKHNIFMQQRGDARIDMNSPALVAMSPDSSFVNTSSTDSSPRAGAKFHRQKDSLSSSISFGASRAGLKNSRGGSGTQYPSSLAVSVSNTPVLVSDAQFGQQKPSFWDSAPYWLYVLPSIRVECRPFS